MPMASLECYGGTAIVQSLYSIYKAEHSEVFTK